MVRLFYNLLMLPKRILPESVILSPRRVQSTIVVAKHFLLARGNLLVLTL